MQISRGGQCLYSRVADFTSELGFHLVWHGEGHGDQQHRPVGLWVECLHRPRLSDVRLGPSLPEPLQGRRSGGAVIADGAVEGDQLSLGGCQHAADDRSLGSVCQWDKPPSLLCCVADVGKKTTRNISALKSKEGWTSVRCFVEFCYNPKRFQQCSNPEKSVINLTLWVICPKCPCRFMKQNMWGGWLLTEYKKCCVFFYCYCWQTAALKEDMATLHALLHSAHQYAIKNLLGGGGGLKRQEWLRGFFTL